MLKPSAPGLVAGALALAMDAVYLTIIMHEGNNDMAQVVPFALLIGGAGAALVGGSVLGDPKLRAALLWPPALVLIGLGVLAIFTIGAVFLVAGVLALSAAVRATAAIRCTSPREG